MGIKIPLFFEYDISTVTPSSIAEFTASDVVPVKNGGTGGSSMADFFAVAAAYDLSAKSVSSMTGVFVDLSATNFSSVNVISTEFSATNVSAVNSISTSLSATTLSAVNLISKEVSAVTASSTHLLVESGVSANAVSAVSLVVEDAMPIPAPWGYVHFTTAGTAQDTIQNIGIGCSKTENISSSDDFSWDDTNKRFNVSAAGTYEFTVNAVLMVAATTTITLELYSTYPGASKLAADTRVHSSIDADIVTLTYVGPFTAGSYAYATTTDDGGTDITIYPGTSMLIKRLK